MLKIEHTYGVCSNTAAIASGSSLDSRQAAIAGAIALFHDIGRFPQYAKYKTFRDADSVNHGLLGARTLIDHNVLSNIEPGEQELILEAVKFHNSFSIPESFSGEKLLFLKLIRDADKLDIYRVFLEYYATPPEKRASATAFGVPDIPEYSDDMLASIMAGKTARYSNIRTENDFRLMKLSWIYDMHFDETVRLLCDKQYPDKIINMLPDTESIKRAMSRLKKYISERLNNEQNN